MKFKFEKPTVIFFEAAVHPWSIDDLEEKLRNAYEDGSDAIVLFMRSPGGYANKVAETARLVDRIAQEKPVFAYTDTYMASAAYWIGASADRIYAAPSASVGSVGAYVELLDYSKQNEMNGVEQTLLRAGDDKARIGINGQLRECDRTELQEELNDNHSQFKSSVLAHRKIDPANLTGKVFKGEKALELGFIDGFADSLHDFLNLLQNGGIENG